MASAPATLMTVEEFLKLPEQSGAYTYELHNGEVVRVTRPKLKHTILQERLRDLIRAAAPEGSFVAVELPFCPLPEHEVRCADVGYISRERWAAVDPEGMFQGAPDLVVEVL